MTTYAVRWWNAHGEFQGEERFEGSEQEAYDASVKFEEEKRAEDNRRYLVDRVCIYG